MRFDIPDPILYKPASEESLMAAEKNIDYKMYNIEQLQAQAKKLRKQLESATKELDFMLAAKLRDEILEIEKLITEQKA